MVALETQRVTFLGGQHCFRAGTRANSLSAGILPEVWGRGLGATEEP